MDFFKTIFVSFLCSQLPLFPITAVAQTGSSFFYYYSPNQPMLLNSQTFGSNAQSFSGDAFNFLPSRLTNNKQRNTQLSPLSTFPDRTSHFLPQGNHDQQSSLLDKISFENGPPPLRSPFQYQYNYDVNPTPSTTRATPLPSRFLTQPQPSPKLFNFLNQPFPFFENSFGRFQQPQNFNNQQSQSSGNELVQSTPTPLEDGRRQNFHSYYETPSQVDFDTPKSTPLSFSVNQYFTTKTTNGPASYTFTIEANPTAAGPTAKVHVNLGSESLPSTFPTLPSLSFTLPSRDDKESEIKTKSEDIATTTSIPVSTTSTTVASDEILVSTMSSSTPFSSTEAATEPSSTTATTTTTSSTTTTEISLDQQDGNSLGRKPVKRVIIVRRKLAGKRRLSAGENINDLETKENEIGKSASGLTADKSTTENPPILSTTEESVLRSTTTTEATSTTSINPIITTTEKAETISTTTESPQPTTFRPTLNDIPSSTSTEPILSTTTNAPVKNISLTTTNDEYEYYYYDDEEDHEESSSKPSSNLEQISSTEAPSSTTKIPSSTLAIEPEDIFQATTMPPFILEDEVIEPLSTTEPILSTTENIMIPSTTSTENIPVTTYRPSISTSTEEDQEVATTTTMASNETEQATEMNEVEEPVTEKVLDSQSETSENESNNSNYDFQDEYIYSQEDYIVSDPLEDERILEAQRTALQTALKNIRSRLQNVSTTEKPEDDDQPKKFIRRPIKVNIPSRTSNTFEGSISGNVDDDELDGDSRMNIIQKIQIFRTKLRKVSNGAKFKTTTKRPRRVTRPSEPSASSSTSTEEPVTTTTRGNIPELVMKIGSSTEIILASTTETPSTTSILEIEPQRIATEESQQTTKLVGSLNITEVLPSSTQSTSTTALLMELDKHEKILKNDTEDLVLTGYSTPSSTEDALIATTVEPNKLNVSTEESVVETSTSRTIRERKVKVILKRRKGAPSGRGTVARQVIRTRTRVKGREEEKSSPSL